MATNKNDIHVAMLPWSAFGHMLPFLELAMALANNGVRVSYISTPRNISRLPKIPPNLASLLQYVSLPMPTVSEGNFLPEGAEATIDVEFDQIPALEKAYDLLYEPVKEFVSTHLPNWVISDFAANWMPQIAEECRVQLMYFSTFNAAALYSYYQNVYVQTGSGLLEKCHAIAIRSCREFEDDKIDLLQSLTNKLVVPVGMLPPAPKAVQQGSGNWDECFKWLDRQSEGSVIYVSFGSETKLTKDQVYEIAYGLELAQLPFIWALKKPAWVVDDIQLLPPDFKTRISNKGIVCIGWAPQLEILAHPSVGGSLFHCGWSSIIETLQHGHTPILLPFIYDQSLNASILVQKGLGIEVERREDGSFTRNDIAHALTRAMVGDEAEKFKTRAQETVGLLGNQKHYVDGFVGFLKENGKT